MSTKKIRALLKMQLNDMAKWNVSTYNLEGVDSSNYTYSGGNYKLYVMEPVEGSIKQAGKLIKKVLKGKKLKSSYEYDGPINTVTSSSNEHAKKSTSEVQNTTKRTAKYEYAKCNDPINGVCTTSNTDEKEPICDSELVINDEGVQECSTELTCDSGYEMKTGKCIKEIVDEITKGVSYD